MEAPSLFVGLVTHEETRFAESRSEEGLAAAMQKRIPGSLMQEEARNLWHGEAFGKAETRESFEAKRQMERRWLRYLSAPRSQRLGVGARHLVSRGRGIFRENPSSLTRLLNIEFAHLSLWRAAVESGAPWALILEDDGWTEDVVDLTAGVMGLMGESRPPAFVNLSSSFSPRQLRIERLLRTGRCSWQGRRTRSILESTRPVTNTVCAILYSVTFLEQLLTAWDSLQVFPVVPIDWKLNQVLMTLQESSQFPSHGCWFVEPGPVIQGSMRRPGKMVR